MILHSKPMLHMISWCISISAGLAAVVMDESTGFSLGVIFVVFSGIWWLGRKLQSLEDRLERAQEWRVEVKEQLEDQSLERKEILRFLRGLPCNQPHVCKPKEQQ